MTIAVVWGFEGVATGLILLAVGLGGLFLSRGSCLGFAGSLLVVLMSAVAFWSAFHVRTVEFTIAELRVQQPRDSFFVDDTRGNTYGVSYRIYRRLRKGERVRCRMTAPVVIFVGSILSCEPVRREVPALVTTSARRTPAPA